MRYIPILSWLPHFDRSWLSIDVIAGSTLWGLVVPEAMAYAGIAGLYTLLASLLACALLGTSRHFVVQATSATAALLASSVAAALIATVAAAAAVRRRRWKRCKASSESWDCRPRRFLQTI
jgi:sulfate permease, SulP family